MLGREDDVEDLLSQAWEHWQGASDSKPDLAAAEALFRAASRLESGLADFWYYQFLSSQKRYDEASAKLELSAKSGFMPAHIRMARDICRHSGYGNLSPELLERMRLAGEAGFLRGEYLYLQNNLDGLRVTSVFRRLFAVLSIKRKISKRVEKNGWKDRSIWG